MAAFGGRQPSAGRGDERVGRHPEPGSAPNASGRDTPERKRYRLARDNRDDVAEASRDRAARLLLDRCKGKRLLHRTCRTCKTKAKSFTERESERITVARPFAVSERFAEPDPIAQPFSIT